MVSLRVKLCVSAALELEDNCVQASKILNPNQKNWVLKLTDLTTLEMQSNNW